MKTFPFLTILFLSLNTNADYWIRKADFANNRGSAVSFMIGGKGYVGTGFNSEFGIYYKDFWAYDPNSDSWTQIADLPGPERARAFGFAIGTKGYVGAGISISGNGKDFYEYDATLNVWNQKGDLPDWRYEAVAFSIGTKGYFGTGISFAVNSDFWEYDPTIDTWTRKTDFAAGVRCRAFAFSINGKGYVGGGNDSTTILRKDFYEYDPSTDSWNARTDFGGNPLVWGSSFVLNGKGYVIPGYDSVGWTNQLWRYDPLTDQWLQKADFIGTPAIHSSAFSLNNRGYLSIGDTSESGTGSGSSTNTLWEYTPDSIDAVEELEYFKNFWINYSRDENQIILRSDYKMQVSIYNDIGKLIARIETLPGEVKMEVSNWDFGVYFARAEMNQHFVTRKFLKY